MIVLELATLTTWSQPWGSGGSREKCSGDREVQWSQSWGRPTLFKMSWSQGGTMTLGQPRGSPTLFKMSWSQGGTMTWGQARGSPTLFKMSWSQGGTMTWGQARGSHTLFKMSWSQGGTMTWGQAQGSFTLFKMSWNQGGTMTWGQAQGSFTLFKMSWNQGGTMTWGQLMMQSRLVHKVLEVVVSLTWAKSWGCQKQKKCPGVFRGAGKTVVPITRGGQRYSKMYRLKRPWYTEFSAKNQTQWYNWFNPKNLYNEAIKTAKKYFSHSQKSELEAKKGSAD